MKSSSENITVTRGSVRNRIVGAAAGSAILSVGAVLGVTHLPHSSHRTATVAEVPATQSFDDSLWVLSYLGNDKICLDNAVYDASAFPVKQEPDSVCNVVTSTIDGANSVTSSIESIDEPGLQAFAIRLKPIAQLCINGNIYNYSQNVLTVETSVTNPGCAENSSTLRSGNITN